MILPVPIRIGALALIAGGFGLLSHIREYQSRLLHGALSRRRRSRRPAARPFRCLSMPIAGLLIPGLSPIISKTLTRTRRHCSAAKPHDPSRVITRHSPTHWSARFSRSWRSIYWAMLPARTAIIFVPTREQRVGKTLEAFVADRDARLAGFRASLGPLRTTLKVQPFFGGAEPLYADYALFGPFQWARCISPFALLEDGDPVKQWRDQLLDRFEGLARKAVAYDV